MASATCRACWGVEILPKKANPKVHFPDVILGGRSKVYTVENVRKSSWNLFIIFFTFLWPFFWSNEIATENTTDFPQNVAFWKGKSPVISGKSGERWNIISFGQIHSMTCEDTLQLFSISQSWWYKPSGLGRLRCSMVGFGTFMVLATCTANLSSSLTREFLSRQSGSVFFFRFEGVRCLVHERCMYINVYIYLLFYRYIFI